jgi:hypothetical protein
MEHNSIASMIFPLLVVLFFVLPSLLKFFGKRAMDGKGAEKQEPADEELEPQVPRETLPGRPEKTEPMGRPMAESGRGPVTNEPIHPKWF